MHSPKDWQYTSTSLAYFYTCHCALLTRPWQMGHRISGVLDKNPNKKCPTSGTARPNCYRNPQIDFEEGTCRRVDERRNTIDKDHLYRAYYTHRPSYLFDLATVLIFNTEQSSSSKYNFLQSPVTSR
jgi:hypothetical protein